MAGRGKKGTAFEVPFTPAVGEKGKRTTTRTPPHLTKYRSLKEQRADELDLERAEREKVKEQRRRDDARKRENRQKRRKYGKRSGQI